jgi:hypothetical protein
VSVITATRVTSLPVPAVVGTATSGSPGPGHLVVAGVGADVALVGEGDRGRLGRVHRAAAADRHDAVGLVLAQGPQRALDVVERRVGLHVAEDRDGGVAGPEALDERAGRPLVEQEAIGDDERALDADARDVLSQIVGRPAADQQVLGQVQLDGADGRHGVSSPGVSGTLLR